MRDTGRVLVLDDDPLVARTIGSAVEAMGIQCRLVTRPEGFFDLLDRWEPTHILVDLMMPDMDGLEIMAELADRRCPARIVIISGVGSSALDAAKRIAERKGLRVEVLSKPIRQSNLKDVLGAGGPALEPADAARAPEPARAFTDEELAGACRNGDFEIVYQPKVRCSDESVTGLEALARWNRPGRGSIAPRAFIPAAEENGLIDAFTVHVLSHAVGWFTSLEASKHLSLAINVSARSLTSPGFADALTECCEAVSMSPEKLTLELTESAALEDPTSALDLLTKLRVKGFQLAIDDFGAGYSSMMQLARLPFSELKIDTALVLGMETSEAPRSIIRSTIDLGHRMGLSITAEGVETRAAFDYLAGAGCDHVQGYLFARPMDATAARNWIAHRAPRT